MKFVDKLTRSIISFSVVSTFQADLDVDLYESFAIGSKPEVTESLKYKCT